MLLRSTLVAAGFLALAATSTYGLTYSQEVLADNPLAYYRLGDIGATAVDSAPLAGLNNGALDGGTVTQGQASLVPGTSDGATRFGPGNGRFVVPGFDKIGTGYTVEYWINVATQPNNCCAPLVGDGESGADFFLMNYLIGPDQGQTGDIRPHYSFANAPVATDSNQALATNQTYHIVTTWDSLTGTNNGKIYINGVLDKQINVTQNIVNDLNQLFLGRDGREGYNTANFVLDEVALYDYALSGDRVAAHFAAAALPEPATFGMAVLGVSTLFLRRRRTA